MAHRGPPGGPAGFPPGAKVTEVARRNEVAASLLFTWRRQPGRRR
ncbi:transposase [Rhodopseudomonas palustris]